MAEHWPIKKEVPLAAIKRIVEAAKRSLSKGSKFTEEVVAEWLGDASKDKTGQGDHQQYTISDFFYSTLKAFAEKKLEWKDVAVLQNHYPPKGRPVLDSKLLERVIRNKDLESRLPDGQTWFAHASFPARVQARYELVTKT